MSEGRGRKAIHFAAARADTEIFNFIHNLTDNKEETDEEGNTAIFIAAQHDIL